MDVTADELIQLHRCPRLVYLNTQGSREQWQEPEAGLDTFRQQRHVWRQHIWQQQHFQMGGDPWAGPIERAGGIPLVVEVNGITLRSLADGLVWTGEFYEPVEIRTAKSVKLEYELRLCLLARQLGELQGHVPGHGWVILGNGRWKSVRLWRRQPLVTTLLERWQQIRRQTTLPAVTMSRQRCLGCGWQTFCRQQGDPLSLLPGLHMPHYHALLQAGIHTLDDLHGLDPETLQAIAPVSPSQAERLLFQAVATREQRPIWRTPVQFPGGEALYFDVEAHGETVCVLGVLVQQQSHSQFHGLWARDPTQERQIWYAFLDVIRRHPTAPIYHFSRFEVQTCQRLAHRHGIPHYSLETLLERLVDLEAVIKQAVFFPVSSYSLKHLASWLGFTWRPVQILGQAQSGNGLQAITWYEQWLTTRDPEYIRALLTYNEDDCRATHHLQHWLAQAAQVPHQLPSPQQ